MKGVRRGRLVSQVTVAKAGNDLYAATIEDKLHMKIGPGDWSPNHNNVPGKWKSVCTGRNFAVWVKEE
jgi:alpha-amylase